MADVNITNNADAVMSAKAKAILRGLEACGMTAETYAKQGCPVDTGRLRNSIAHAVNEEDQAAYIGSNVEYAPAQEFGDNFKHTTGGPHFLKNAAGNHTEEYKNLIEQSMKAAEE